MNKIEVYEREDGRFAWRLIAQNGQIIATDGGQGYERRAFAEEMARKTVVTAFPIFTEEIQADGLEGEAMTAIEQAALAQTIANSFYGMEGGEGAAPDGPNSGDMQLAYDIIAAGWRRA